MAAQEQLSDIGVVNKKDLTATEDAGNSKNALDVNIQTSAITLTTTVSGDVEVVQPTHDDLNANANIQVGDADVSNLNPVPINDAGGSITVDGTVAATQSGTWNINDITGTVSLPTGAATAANQLPDGHNVTVDNAAGASAVNIQDGGNSITVDDGGSSITIDGTVSVSGDVEVVQPTHDDLNANANIQIGNVDVSTSNAVPVEGRAANGATLVGNPVPIAFMDLSGDVTIPTAISAGGTNVVGVIPLDSAGHQIDILTTGEIHSLVGSTTTAKAGAGYLSIDANRNVLVVGSIAHDSADSGNPLLIGARARDFRTNGFPADTAEADRARSWSTLDGRLAISDFTPRKGEQTLTALDATYNNTTTANNSADIDIKGYRVATFNFSILSANSPTSIQFFLQTKSSDGTTYHNYVNGYWSRFVYEDTATNPEINESVTFELPAVDTIRIRVEATGTTASDTFTVDDSEIWLRG